MAKPVAGHAFVVKRKCFGNWLWNWFGIDFLVLIMARFFMEFRIDFIDFLGIEKRPFQINIRYWFWRCLNQLELILFNPRCSGWKVTLLPHVPTILYFYSTLLYSYESIVWRISSLTLRISFVWLSSCTRWSVVCLFVSVENVWVDWWLVKWVTWKHFTCWNCDNLRTGENPPHLQCPVRLADPSPCFTSPKGGGSWEYIGKNYQLQVFQLDFVQRISC